MRVLAEIGARGVDGQRPVTLARLVSQAGGPHTVLPYHSFQNFSQYIDVAKTNFSAKSWLQRYIS